MAAVKELSLLLLVTGALAFYVPLSDYLSKPSYIKKRETPDGNELLVNVFNQMSEEDSAVLSRVERATNTPVVFCDYVIERLLHRIILKLSRENNIELHADIDVIIQLAIEKHVRKTRTYKALFSDTEKSGGSIQEFLNNFSIWNTYARDCNNKRMRIIDLIIEILIRGSIGWLCDNGHIEAKLHIEILVKISLEIIRDENFYQVIIQEEDDVSGLLELVTARHWWKINGTLTINNEFRIWEQI